MREIRLSGLGGRGGVQISSPTLITNHRQMHAVRPISHLPPRAGFSDVEPMKHRWSLLPPQPLLTDQLAARLQVSPLLAQCLLNRGLSESEALAAFLEPRLKSLADPFLLPAMDAAIARLLCARADGESVVVFGDYDVDGVCSTALLLETFERLGIVAASYLPHRMDEGYGLSQGAVETCLQQHPASLLVAVDCGSTAVATIAWLRDRGVDTVVLDHHQCSDPHPAAVALVNPLAASARPPGAVVPFAELCSAGLAFKLAHALVKRGREEGLAAAADFDVRPLLDLVALATIADIVPLVAENRILVTAGLARLNETQRPGLLALKEVARCPARLGAYEVGFQLGPRLNAAGRLETAEAALQLLRARSYEEALPLAQALDARNRERQTIERNIADQAIGAVRARFNPESDFVIVEAQLLWHLGVVGIVASRVLKEFYRPTLIIGGDGEAWRGSGRSIEGFDLAAALRQCDDLLIRHGGHAMAAGVTVHPDKLDALRERLNQLARQSLQPAQLQPALRLDAETPLADLTLERMTELDRLRPFGPANPAVQFCARGLTHRKPLLRLGADRQHVKLWPTDGTRTLEAVWWGAGEASLPVGHFDLAFAPQINEYNGSRTVQLKVLDWRPAEG
jgi:single-stranded-DNA-specific exonuclease